MRRRDFLAATAALLAFPVSRLAAAAPPPRPKLPPLPPKPRICKFLMVGGPADGETLDSECDDKGLPARGRGHAVFPELAPGSVTYWDALLLHHYKFDRRSGFTDYGNPRFVGCVGMYFYEHTEERGAYGP